MIRRAADSIREWRFNARKGDLTRGAGIWNGLEVRGWRRDGSRN
nr:MAG TPA: hypothetical protein [Caudoviricetes sp.]